MSKAKRWSKIVTNYHYGDICQIRRIKEPGKRVQDVIEPLLECISYVELNDSTKPLTGLKRSAVSP